MEKVRTRYAPSPTGVPHLGNIRTALFSYLISKKNNGQFILRIEDTNQKKILRGSIDKIKSSLNLLGLKWDEEYKQSDRLPLYKKNLDMLIKSNHAYQEDGAWRFKVEKDKKIFWEDAVYKKIEFNSDVIEDFTILKSDGFPTYHFASVIDDHEMKISHVLRGDEWISSTPKHLLLYKALKYNPPTFVHLPPIIGPNKKKLSKREGAKSIFDYIEEGYLPEALINFLVLLGWSPKGDKEIFTLEELIKEFSIERINKNSSVFNTDKLIWFNKKYIQKLSSDQLSEKVKGFSSKSAKLDNKKLNKITNLVRDRMTTLADFENLTKIFFAKGNQKPPEKKKIESTKNAIEQIKSWEEKEIEKTLEKWIKDSNVESADFKNTLRLAVFADHTPPIYQSLAILDKNEVVRRIDDAIKKTK